MSRFFGQQKRALGLSAADAIACDVEILALALDAGERLAKLGARYAGCPAAHERVEHGQGIGRKATFSAIPNLSAPWRK